MKSNKTYKILVVSILLLCSWSLAGHIIWSAARQSCYTYVHHIKNKRNFRDTLIINKQHLHDASHVTWIKKNEIRHLGRMFDIKQTLNNGDTVILVGHYDDFEHELFEVLSNFFEEGNNEESESPPVDVWGIYTAVLPGGYLQTYPPFTDNKSQKHYWQNNCYHSIVTPPPHDPPDGFHS